MAGVLISVVVPTYNEEKNIAKCLKALSTQTLPRKDYELIVVDYKSKDETCEVARKYADKVIQQKSKGVGGARNDGAKVAKGEIIATTDADVIVPRFWLERIKNSLSKPGVVAVYGPQEPIEDSIKAKLFFKMMTWSGAVVQALGEPYMGGPNSAFKRKIFEKVGGYSSLPMQDDVEIGFRVKKLGRIAYDMGNPVAVSARRFEKFGYLRTAWNWKKGDLSVRQNRKLEDKYARQEY